MAEVMPNEVDGDSGDEVEGGLPEGVSGERFKAEEEDEFVRKVLDPKLPSEEEVERHFVSGHIPYRNWCPVCIKSKGKDEGHVRDAGNARGLPEYSFDYCFPGDELGFKWVVLVGKERSSGTLWPRLFL